MYKRDYFQEVLYTKSIDHVLAFVYKNYTEEDINMIPDLVVFIDMLVETKRVSTEVLGSVYCNPRIVGVFETLVVVEVDYTEYSIVKPRNVSL